jgi:hypothetical protein
MKHNYAIKGGNIDPGSGQELSGCFLKGSVRMDKLKRWNASRVVTDR